MNWIFSQNELDGIRHSGGNLSVRNYAAHKASKCLQRVKVSLQEFLGVLKTAYNYMTSFLLNDDRDDDRTLYLILTT